jgi:hypothetical protein
MVVAMFALIKDSCIYSYVTSDDPVEGFEVIPADLVPASYASFVGPHLRDRELMRAWIAEQRWQREIAGITVGEQPVSTLREEMPVWQGMLLDIAVFRPGVEVAYEYKPRGGVSVQLTVAQVQRCYECFAWYVQACFAVERALIEMLDAQVPPADIVAAADAAWPQRQFTLVGE